jgi:hypothetical protein
LVPSALGAPALAQCRLADEYDAAQARGEVASSHDGGRSGAKRSRPEHLKPTAVEVGLTGKQVYEFRKIRDAEQRMPGMVRQTPANS